MGIKFVFLWTDFLLYLLVTAAILIALFNRKKEHWQEPWHRIAKRKLGMISLVLLITYMLIGLADSIHFRFVPKNAASSSVVERGVQSLLDIWVYPLNVESEQTYSAPFAIYSSAKSIIQQNGAWEGVYPRLNYGGRGLTNPNLHLQDIAKKSSFAILVGLSISIVFCSAIIFWLARRKNFRFWTMVRQVMKGETAVRWREILLTVSFVILVITYIKLISPYYHILGTDKIGGDTLYATIKSIRTGLIIGTLTTLIMLPFAIFFGAQAGYFGGWRDDAIQYVYTTLSSVPAVLLISAAVLSLQVFISNHPQLFPTLENRADARLLALCIILGITSWTSLCRLLRAEALKLREMDYVKAAIVMGERNNKIIWRHIVPNVFHIILITIVLDFSSLVLAEAVLSYVGVGVDPITPSWGNMINSARLDLAREPAVWWPLSSAFLLMFILVLAANLFADAVRDAFDPRLRNER